jgi:hypothetical protein
MGFSVGKNNKNFSSSLCFLMTSAAEKIHPQTFYQKKSPQLKNCRDVQPELVMFGNSI